MRIQKISPVEPIGRLGKEKNGAEDFREALRKAASRQSEQDEKNRRNGDESKESNIHER